MSLSLFILAIPVYFILIGLEILLNRIHHVSHYRFNDSITNISCGVGEQITGAFFKVLVVGLYGYLYQHYALFNIPANWLTGIFLFVAIDFFYYWFHRYSHVINLFWGGHVVHHQSEEYNLSVALRQGWFQKFFSFVFYLPLAIAGFNPVQFITLSSLVTLYQFWIHTRSIGKLGWMEYVFNTPSHHRVHHGSNPKYIDKNHGGTLIIWDRLFGTFQEEEEEPVYGITLAVNTWNPLVANLQHWRQMYKGLKELGNWKDRIYYVFMPPGWKPIGTNTLEQNPTRTSYQKFDTTVPKMINVYVLIQYIFVLMGATFFLFYFDLLPWSEQIVACVLLIWAIVNTGSLLELKPYSVLSETGRLVITIPLLYCFFQLNNAYYLAISILIVASLFIWLIQIRKLIQ